MMMWDEMSASVHIIHMYVYCTHQKQWIREFSLHNSTNSFTSIFPPLYSRIALFRSTEQRAGRGAAARPLHGGVVQYICIHPHSSYVRILHTAK